MLFLGLWKTLCVRRGLCRQCPSLWDSMCLVQVLSLAPWRASGMSCIGDTFLCKLCSMLYTLSHPCLSAVDPWGIFPGLCPLPCVASRARPVCGVATWCPDRMAGMPLGGNGSHCLCSSEVKLLQAGKQIQQLWNPINYCVLK